MSFLVCKAKKSNFYVGGEMKMDKTILFYLKKNLHSPV